MRYSESFNESALVNRLVHQHNENVWQIGLKIIRNQSGLPRDLLKSCYRKLPVLVPGKIKGRNPAIHELTIGLEVVGKKIASIFC